MISPVLALFAKAPAPGRVKTRLVPPLTAAEAAAIHEASLRDVVALSRSAASDVRLYYDPVGSAEDFMACAFPDLPRIAQVGGDLGTRMTAVFEKLFSGGADRVAIIGTDSPTLPVRYLRKGLDALAAADLVLGPATDGGYYLVGIRRNAWPAARAIFRDIPWSTAHVLEKTLEAATGSGVGVELAETWYDIDRFEDLVAARTDAAGRGHLGSLLDRP